MAKQLNIFFNVEHAPIGAFATFTLGHKGAKGGLGLEMGKPADESVFIGLESATKPGVFETLPFYEGSEDEAKRYDVSKEKAKKDASAPRLVAFKDKDIYRELFPASDSWDAGDLSFTIYTPCMDAPDPTTEADPALKLAYMPAVLAELAVDNSACKRDRVCFFGYAGKSDVHMMRRFEGPIAGIACGPATAIACADEGVESAQGFDMESILQPAHPDNRAFGLGGTAALLATVPAGEVRTFRFAVCFYRGGIATSGMPCSYLYTKWFKSIEEVAAYALGHFDEAVTVSADAAGDFNLSKLSADQRLQFTHALHSYYASTELFLTKDKKPFWVVAEGEYRMMNTLDLMADQAFYEALRNPWTLRNELDWYVDRYAYRDTVRFPGSDGEFPGGISFPHDMGVANNISRPGHSVYEMRALSGCFSHMTHEELVNWLWCGLIYLARTGDDAWFEKRRAVFADGLESLCNRDNPDPAKRTGVMGLDSSRCAGGAEITTYDSLDTSLGQARNNLYIAVKTWGVYACLGELFAKKGLKEPAAVARAQARRAAATVAGAADRKGLLPAIIGEGVESRIIPAIEGLVLPWFCGHRRLVSKKGPYAALLATLAKHLEAVLKPGICLFPDGAWKLSSTSDNSWLSKIYLCQFVARKILGLPWGAAGKRADAAHVQWLLRPEGAYWAWSDQIIRGIATGSKYYPRGVTSILWTLE
jgi:hypothetical protein